MRKRWWWIVGIFLVVVAPIAWYLGSPLVLNKTVNEAFPRREAPASKSFPMSAGATVPEGMTQEQVEDAMTQASKVKTSATEPMPVAAGPAVAVARGAFTGKDGFHQGEGTATVYRVGQSLTLRLEAFKVTNGPALYVILTKRETVESRSDVEAGHVEIARLKGNIGSQNYQLPPDFQLADYRAVVIYCKQFHVIFATAPLQAAQ